MSAGRCGAARETIGQVQATVRRQSTHGFSMGKLPSSIAERLGGEGARFECNSLTVWLQGAGGQGRQQGSLAVLGFGVGWVGVWGMDKGVGGSFDISSGPMILRFPHADHDTRRSWFSNPRHCHQSCCRRCKEAANDCCALQSCGR